MAVAFIAGNGAGNSLSATIDSGTFTIGSQTDKALIVIVTWSAASDTITSVAWDPTGVNEALTSVGSVGPLTGNRRGQAFRRINPSAVTNGIVRVTLTGATVGTLAVFAGAFSGADQTTPAQDFTTNSGTGTAVSVTVPNTTNDDMVMDSFMAANFTDGNPGANQTAIGSEVPPGDVHWASYQDGADGGVMSWTLNTSSFWLDVGVRVVAAGGGGGGNDLSVNLGEAVIGGSIF